MESSGGRLKDEAEKNRRRESGNLQNSRSRDPTDQEEEEQWEGDVVATMYWEVARLQRERQIFGIISMYFFCAF